jgi:DNA helicase INO80
VVPKIEELHQLSEEELRLASSDLEDCEEVWIGELSEYMLETHKRQKQVQVWFDASVLVSFIGTLVRSSSIKVILQQERNSTTAVDMSRHYASRIARIPAPPSPPPPPPSTIDEMTTSRLVSPPHESYEYPMENSMFAPDNEDAIRQPDESMLGAPRLHLHDSGPVMRQAESDNSDIEMPVALNKDQSGHVIKKRKLDELELSVIGELHPSSPDKLALSAAAKGKARQISQRDGTPDSISMTTKAPRKKPGPRKKFDNLPHDTLELLGLRSGPPSISEDVTPGVSRPASPALTATSNIVYELDELVPPLKRAKKVDDVAMLKRVKTLEEAQRKVWTNIARRDVAKVQAIILFLTLLWY